MAWGRDEILAAALQLSESDRLMLAAELLETLPDDLPGDSDDDPAFLNELQRRASDDAPTIRLSEIWKGD